MFIPAKDKMLRKISEFEADAFIIDLEDSVEDHDKEAALKRAIEYLKLIKKNNIFVRINADRASREILALKEIYNIGFVLPKFEEPDIYDEYKDIFFSHYVIALIETPKGIINIENVAATSWVYGIAFGAEDYTAKINMKNTPELTIYQKSKIVTYAKAYGKIAIDTPSFKLDDEESFKKETELSVDLGFDGKMVISPRHIAFVNECFSSYDIENMKRIVEIYESEGKAVNVIDGVVYENMHIQRFKNIIKESKA